jgi:ABC-type glycerol-3-phosphate transport system permease component
MLVLASLLALFPVYVMVTAAFKTQGGFLNHPFSLLSHPTLAGFRTALNDQFPRWLLNSALVTGAAVVATLTLAALAAWGFSRWSFRGRDALLSLLSR